MGSSGIETRRFIDTDSTGGSKFAVIGLGLFGMALARALAEDGAEVVAIDSEMERVEAIKDVVEFAVQCDATDVDALKDHAMDEMDAVIVAIGMNFEATLLASVELLQLGATRVIARASNDTQRRILERVGVAEIISPEQEMGHHIAKLLTRPDLVNYFDLSGEYDVEEIRVPDGLVGEQLADIELSSRYNLNIITIRRSQGEDEEDAEAIGIPIGDTTLHDEDTLVVFGRSEDVERFLSDHE